MSEPIKKSRIPDHVLADWYTRWPTVLPTSVPHEQVLMLIEDVRDARAQVAERDAQIAALREALRETVATFPTYALSCAPLVSRCRVLLSATPAGALDALKREVAERVRGEVMGAALSITQGLRDHGCPIVEDYALESGGDPRPWQDPGFATLLNETWRAVGDALCEMIEKRIRALDLTALLAEARHE